MLVIPGETNEDIVDAWFKTIARQILEDEGLDPDRGAGFIDTKGIGKGKAELNDRYFSKRHYNIIKL